MFQRHFIPYDFLTAKSERTRIETHVCSKWMDCRNSYSIGKFFSGPVYLFLPAIASKMPLVQKTINTLVQSNWS